MKPKGYIYLAYSMLSLTVLALCSWVMYTKVLTNWSAVAQNTLLVLLGILSITGSLCLFFLSLMRKSVSKLPSTGRIFFNMTFFLMLGMTLVEAVFIFYAK